MGAFEPSADIADPLDELGRIGVRKRLDDTAEQVCGGEGRGSGSLDLAVLEETWSVSVGLSDRRPFGLPYELLYRRFKILAVECVQERVEAGSHAPYAPHDDITTHKIGVDNRSVSYTQQ